MLRGRCKLSKTRTIKTAPALDPSRYLKLRGGWWHYYRRVPTHVAALDERRWVQVALKTRSADVAKLRRDAIERADDLYWQSLIAGETLEGTHASYEAARARARVLGFEYRSIADLAENSSIEELIRRIEAISGSKPRDVDAVLGLPDEPRLSVRKTMELYLDEIGVGDTKGMSEKQIRKWREKKLAAADAFTAIVGERALLDITRADATRYHAHWLKRVMGSEGDSVSGNTANRSFGNMRKLFRDYSAYLGLENKNPFDGLSFPDRKSQQQVVPPFEVAFLRDRLLEPGVHDGLNREALGVLLTLIETGARPSEICNLSPAQIHLSAPVPYISIDFQKDRVIKTESSKRDIPLVGVALAVMKRFPNGFPRYKDREETLSATLMKHLRARDLLPTPEHRVYSLRHSFEKRMLEAGLDYEFRRAILGHSVDREKYGDGGAMSWRRDQLLKLTLPFDHAIVP